jgi:hypothetical protein
MHRGPHPDDERLFGPEMVPCLVSATNDVCWLLSRGYAALSSLKLVGDRYELEQRQRMAVSRCACSDSAKARRNARRISIDSLVGQTLLIDGYNVLTTVEAALAGSYILAARDGCYRDMASVHGTWRRVDETVPAIELIGHFLAGRGVGECRWYLDRPVSNSGRLKRILLDATAGRGWPWDVELVADPDRVLADVSGPIVTADSAVLDHCAAWVNLAREIVATCVPQARLVDLAGNSHHLWQNSPEFRSLGS